MVNRKENKIEMSVKNGWVDSLVDLIELGNLKIEGKMIESVNVSIRKKLHFNLFNILECGKISDDAKIEIIGLCIANDHEVFTWDGSGVELSSETLEDLINGENSLSEKVKRKINEVLENERS